LIQTRHERTQEYPVKHLWTDPMSSTTPADRRTSERRAVAMAARLTWKDQRGATRFASVVVRNVSDYGVYLESHSTVSIPLYRLAQFQLEREGRDSEALPDALKQGRVLSAVYRVSPATRAGKPQGLALRLIAEPKRRPADRSEDPRVSEPREEARATA
jgi:hypothetical protein